MDIDLFNYNLPKDRIAQAPVRPRERAKLLYYDRQQDKYRDHHVSDLPQLLLPGDLLVFNVTKVRAARICESRIMNNESGVREILILKPLEKDGQFECLLKGKNIKIGETISVDCHPELREGSNWILKRVQDDAKASDSSPSFAQGYGRAQQARNDREIKLFVVDRLTDGMGRFVVQVEGMASSQFLDLIEEIGRLPLPPYIHNPQIEGFEQELYQPIFAKELGSVASPTASLHFSPKLVEELKSKGIQTAEVILHVGLGTFLPVRVADTKDHIMHSEYMEVSQELIDKIRYTKENGGRVIAVGTTVARALESVRGLTSDEVKPLKGETKLFIQPGFEFKVIDGLLTNFHMPKSTLLMMVSAFVGREKLFELYQHSLDSNYRFLSFGDCMLLV